MKKLFILIVLLCCFSCRITPYGLTVLAVARDRAEMKKEIKHVIDIAVDYIALCMPADVRKTWTYTLREKFKEFEYNVYSNADIVIYKNKCTNAGFETCVENKWPCKDFIVILDMDDKPDAYVLTAAVFVDLMTMTQQAAPQQEQ